MFQLLKCIKSQLFYHMHVLNNVVCAAQTRRSMHESGVIGQSSAQFFWFTQQLSSVRKFDLCVFLYPKTITTMLDHVGKLC